MAPRSPSRSASRSKSSIFRASTGRKARPAKSTTSHCRTATMAGKPASGGYWTCWTRPARAPTCRPMGLPPSGIRTSCARWLKPVTNSTATAGSTMCSRLMTIRKPSATRFAAAPRRSRKPRASGRSGGPVPAAPDRRTPSRSWSTRAICGTATTPATTFRSCGRPARGRSSCCRAPIFPTTI